MLLIALDNNNNTDFMFFKSWNSIRNWRVSWYFSVVINNMSQMLSINFTWTQNIPLRLKGTSGCNWDKWPQLCECIHVIYIFVWEWVTLFEEFTHYGVLLQLWPFDQHVLGNIHIKPSEESKISKKITADQQLSKRD